jgi:hypothetical protein
MSVEADRLRLTSPMLTFGDPNELPEGMRSPMPNSVAADGTLLSRHSSSAQLRTAVIYGSYIAQLWRLEDCTALVDQVHRAAMDLTEHSGVVLSSGYRKPILWSMLDVEVIAGQFLPVRSVGNRPRNVRLAFAAKCCLPRDAVIGRDIRTATKCYVGCRKLRGDLGVFELSAEERRARDAAWWERIDESRALRVAHLTPEFCFEALSRVSS